MDERTDPMSRMLTQNRNIMKSENRILLIVAFLSFFAGFIFRHDDIYKVTLKRFLVIAAVVVAYNAWLYVRKVDWERRRCVIMCSIMGFLTLMLMQIMSWFRLQENISDNMLVLSTVVLFLVLVSCCVFCVCVEHGVSENTVILLIFSGFLLRLFYVIMTQGHLVQNDLGSFRDDSWGNLGYVYQILATGRLPVQNPITHYQLYHPPLHYALAALCAGVYYVLFGVQMGQVDEVMQMLPLFYSTATLVFLNKIGLQFRCSSLGRCAMLGFAGFLPYSIFLGGALNNDSLVILLMIMCVYFTIKWYNDPSLKNILVMAVLIGCAMMTKISGAMIAPAMAIVMLYRAWKDRKHWVKWVKQFACFGAVSFPLGLWYYVLQWIRFRMPFWYAPAVPEELSQYIGMYSLGDRFRDYGHALESLALRWGPAPDVDYNIPVSLVKYSVFNELGYYTFTPSTKFIATIMFWATAVLFILLIAAFVAWLFMRRNKTIYKVFFGSCITVILFAYLKFCLEYPHVCAMNVRYVMTAVYLGMLILGAAVTGLQERLAGKGLVAGRIYAVSVSCLTVFYMLCSTLLSFHLEWMLY